MKISTKGEYGIRAMLYIAMQGDEGPVTSHEIAQHQGIPEPSLRDILITLEGQTTGIDQILALPCTIGVGTEHCVIREVFLEIKQAVERILSNTTLESLVTRQREILTRRILVPLDLPPH